MRTASAVVMAALVVMAGASPGGRSTDAPESTPVALAASGTGFHGTFCVESTRRALRWGVRHAVREWNSVPVGRRLVLRERCASGRFRVRIDAMRIPGRGTGVARRQDDGSYRVYFNTGSLWQYPTDRWCVKGHTATHELGHVLGLPHFPARGDMVMGYGNWWKRCGDLRPADRLLKRRYAARPADGTT